MLHTWIVSPDVRRKRLDIFISEALTTTTRSQIAKLLKQGAGRVNGRVASVHQFLQPGDRVEFDDQAKHSTKSGVQSPEPRIQNEGLKTPDSGPKLRIIHETPDWIVINKPAGLLVHPDRRSEEPTLVDALLAYDPTIAKVGEDPSRPGIVHRLDKEASGLMVIARTQAAFDDLKRQFAEHAVEKHYLALVYGSMEEEEGEIKFRIARSKTKQRMAARPSQEEEGKAAWTHFTTRKRFHNASLLELDIFSGRTHQIRAHLLAYNHPIMGDPLYKRKSEQRNIKAPRLMLQSIHLGFRDPAKGEPRLFDLPPDPEFAELISQLS